MQSPTVWPPVAIIMATPSARPVGTDMHSSPSGHHQMTCLWSPSGHHQMTCLWSPSGHPQMDRCLVTLCHSQMTCLWSPSVIVKWTGVWSPSFIVKWTSVWSPSVIGKWTSVWSPSGETEIDFGHLLVSMT